MNIIGRKVTKNIDMWQYVNKILLTLQRCEILRLRMKPKNQSVRGFSWPRPPTSHKP